MFRDVNSLRCSKLNSYAEFNRMVQAIVHNVSSTTFTIKPGLQDMHGTSAEHCFYHTLTAMLRDIVSNSNPAVQKKELEKVYTWFCINKPLLGPKTKSKVQKPCIALTTRHTAELERPQTAPAAIYSQAPNLTQSKPRPHSTSSRCRQTFTSSFMSRSLERDMERAGQPRSLLTTPRRSQSGAHRREQTLPTMQQPTPLFTRSQWHGRPLGSAHQQSPSVVSFPSPDSLSGELQHAQRPSTVDFGTIFALAPSVAAQMSLDKDAQAEHQAVLKLVLSQSSARKLKLMSAPSYVPSAPAATPIPNRVEDEGKPVSTAAASPLVPGSDSSHVTTVAETSNAPEEQERPSTMAAAISCACSSQLDLSTEPCTVHDCFNHGAVKVKEVAENGGGKQQAGTHSEKAQTEATEGVKVQVSKEAIRTASASTSQSGQVDQRKPHQVTWHSPTKAKDLDVRKKGDPQLSADVGNVTNGMFLTVLPAEMASRYSTDHVMEVKSHGPVLPAANSNEYKEHQQCSSNPQHTESPTAVASREQGTRSMSETATSSKLETKKDERAKSDGAKESKRSKTPLTVVSLSLSLSQDTSCNNDKQVATHYSPAKKKRMPSFTAGFKKNMYRPKNIPSCRQEPIHRGL